MKTFPLLIGFLFCEVSGAADLNGTVQRKDGQPVPGAWVKIATAHFRTGSSPVCPSCWMDCKKWTKADASGNFRIAGVNDQLVFRLLVLAEGYAPLSVPNIDPSQAPAHATLEPRDLSKIPAEQLIRGRIVDPENNPVAGVRVSPLFPQKGLDGESLTNADGRFVLVCGEPVKKNQLDVRPESFVACRVPVKIVHKVAEPVDIQLRRGVTIEGKVLADGKPVLGVRIGAIEKERTFQRDLPAVEAETGEGGTFRIINAPSNDELVVYGLMASLAGKGAIPLRVLKTGDDDSTSRMDDFLIQKACTIKGQFHLADEKSFPAGSHINISRDQPWEWLVAEVSPDGHFEATGLPAGEEIEVGVPDNPPDYHIQSVSVTSFGIDSLNSNVHGVIHGDIEDLKVELAWKDKTKELAERWRQLIQKEYKDFLKVVALTPEKESLFLDAKGKERGTWTQWQEGGKLDWPACKLAIRAECESEIKAALGEDFLRKYRKFEDLQTGRGYLAGLLEFHPGDWLTAAEKDSLIHSISRRLNDFFQHEGGKYYYSQTKEEKLKNAKAESDYLVAAGTETLPPAKFAILREWAETGRSRNEAQIQEEENAK